LSKKGILRFSSWFLLILSLILGFLEQGFLGALLAFALYLITSLCFFAGLIPIFGVPIYLFGCQFLHSWIQANTLAIPVTSAFLFWSVFLLTVLVNVFVTLLLFAIITGE